LLQLRKEKEEGKEMNESAYKIQQRRARYNNPSRLLPLRKRLSKRNRYIRDVEKEIKKVLNLMIEKNITHLDLDTMEVR
jgi:chemotaxis protein histidine kinase CheA